MLAEEEDEEEEDEEEDEEEENEEEDDDLLKCGVWEVEVPRWFAEESTLRPMSTQYNTIGGIRTQ